MKSPDYLRYHRDEWGRAVTSADPADVERSSVRVPGYTCPACGGPIVRDTITDVLLCKQSGRCGRAFAALADLSPSDHA